MGSVIAKAWVKGYQTNNDLSRKDNVMACVKHLSLIHIYVNAQNLFTISDVPQIDPENTQQQGWTYPQMKAFNVGLTLQF